MAQLAPRPFAFVVKVHMSVGQFQYPFNVAMLADDVDHAAQATGFHAAEWVAADGTDVVLELAGHGAFDAPVAGVVHSGCNFVGYSPSCVSNSSRVNTPT